MVNLGRGCPDRWAVEHFGQEMVGGMEFFYIARFAFYL